MLPQDGFYEAKNWKVEVTCAVDTGVKYAKEAADKFWGKDIGESCQIGEG